MIGMGLSRLAIRRLRAGAASSATMRFASPAVIVVVVVIVVIVGRTVVVEAGVDVELTLARHAIFAERCLAALHEPDSRLNDLNCYWHTQKKRKRKGSPLANEGMV
jgi:hypothetical protein